MRRFLPIFLFCIVIAPKQSLSQACSDPGLCTIGTLNTATLADTLSGTDYKNAGFSDLLNTPIASEKISAAAEFGYGIGDRKTSIYTVFLRGGIRIKERLILAIKIPYVFVNGDLGSVNGIGDITVNVQNEVMSRKKFKLAYTLGIIIPSNNGNMKSGGNQLPMVYQSSLGFYGAMAGITLSTKRWNFAAGYQKNFGRNGNEFLTDNLILDPLLAGYDTLNRKRTGYGSSRQLQNSGDVMLRAEYILNYKKISAAIGALPIYRLGNSTIKLENGEIRDIDKSDGLTFNITGGLTYRLNRNWLVGVNGGFPLINRKVAPDGLRRQVVLLLRITRKFW